MRNFTRTFLFAAAISSAAMASCIAPSFADEATKSGMMSSHSTMSPQPMKADPMATNTMAAAPIAHQKMKSDCNNNAGMEKDAMKKEAMPADCNAITGDAMKSRQMAPKQ